MTWRVAESLTVLESEAHAVYPAYTFGTIGDPAHAAEASDHNPNAAGVVCALDIMCGINMALAEAIRTSGNPDLKYVIHNGRIASRTYGMTWRPYTGSDPHTSHIHVSVGVGFDGQSQPPYDDTVPWGINRTVPTSTMEDAPMHMAHVPSSTIYTIYPDHVEGGKVLAVPMSDFARVQAWQAAGVRYVESPELDGRYFNVVAVDAYPAATGASTAASAPVDALKPVIEAAVNEALAGLVTKLRVSISA